MHFKQKCGHNLDRKSALFRRVVSIFLLIGLLCSNVMPMPTVSAESTFTIYFAAPSSWLNYTVKVNACQSNLEEKWTTVDMTYTGASYVYNNTTYYVYTADVEEIYGGFDVLQFQRYNGSAWQEEYEAASSWVTKETMEGNLWIPSPVGDWVSYATRYVYYDATLSKLSYWGSSNDNGIDTIPMANDTEYGDVVYCYYWNEDGTLSGSVTMNKLSAYTSGSNTWSDVYEGAIPEEAEWVLFYSSDDMGTIPTDSAKTTDQLIPSGLSKPCFYADSSDKYLYSASPREGYWDEPYQIRDAETEKVTDVVDITQKTFTPQDGALYLSTTFFDYYTDYELNGWNRDTYKENNGASQQNWVTFRQLNQALSDYYETRSVTYPLYVGHFQPSIEGYGVLFSEIADTLDLYGYSNYNRFFASNNSELNESGQTGYYNYAMQGLTSDPASLPMFNASFLTGSNSKNTVLGEVYNNVAFPFTQQDIDGVDYWVFDSSVTTLSLRQDSSSGQYYLQDVGNQGWSQNVNSASMTEGVSSTYGFFPFNETSDDMWANTYNYGFGTCITLTFRLTEDGMVTNKDGVDVPIEFTFSGDDDVWVFIDENLALDMGGSHGQVGGSLNFATMKANVDRVKSGSTEKSFTISGNMTDEHTLTMYYMERGMWESNMKITFNFPYVEPEVVPLDISVTKQWKNSDGTTLTDTPSSVYVQLQQSTNGTTWSDVSGQKVLLSASNSWTHTFEDLDTTYLYRVMELSGSTVIDDGGTVTLNNVTYTVTYDHSANSTVITNTAPVEKAAYSVTKKWVDTNGNTLTSVPSSVYVQLQQSSDGTTWSDVSGQKVQLTANNSWTYTFEDLDATYQYRVMELPSSSGTAISNNGTVTYSAVEYTVTYVHSDTATVITNTAPVETVSFTVTKEWVDTNGNELTSVPSSVSVRLQRRTGSGSWSTVATAALNSSNSWSYTFTELDATNTSGTEYEYRVMELNGSTVIDDGGTVTLSNVTYTVTYVHSDTSTVITNTAPVETVSFTVTKEWVDTNGNTLTSVPSSVSVRLQRRTGSGSWSTVATATLNSSNSWSYTFTELDATNTSGTEYEYRVMELNGSTVINDGGTVTLNNVTYTVTYVHSDTSTVITNTAPVETVAFTVTKEWVDTNGNTLTSVPSSVSVRLQRRTGSGSWSTVATATLNSSNSWSYTFTELDATNTSGTEYEYRVMELNGSTVINDGGTVTLNNVTYTVTYVHSDTATVITNTAPVETVSFTVTKEWVDTNGNTLTSVPSSVSVRLQRRTGTGSWSTVATATLNSSNSWSYTFTDLDATNTSGTEYEYRVMELSGSTVIDDGGTVTLNNVTYTVTYVHSDTATVITNTAPVETVDISVSKEWMDGSGEPLAFSPDSVYVRLQRRTGTGSWSTVATAALNSSNNWSYTFTEQDAANTSGTEYEYRVVELTGQNGTVLEDGDTVTFDGAEYAVTYQITGNETVITNTIPNISLSVSKEWVNTEDVTLPTTVYVQLQSRTGTGSWSAVASAALNSSNSWAYTFEDLAPYSDAGVEYEFRIVELTGQNGNAVEDGGTTTLNSVEYTVTYTTSGSSTVITNTAPEPPEPIDIAVTKQWQDADGNSVSVSTMSGSIYVILQRRTDDAEEWTDVASDTLGGWFGSWSTTFTDQDAADASGTAYQYRVVELTGRNGTVLEESDTMTFSSTQYEVIYTVSGNSFTITNRQVRLTSDLEITKLSAVDNSKLQGVTFQLEKQNDSSFETITLTTGDDGMVKFEGLSAGTYYLTETKAADGYNLLAAPVTIVVTEGSGACTITADGSQLTTSVSGSVTTATLTVYNKPVLQMPATGGTGGFEFWILGGLFMTAAPLLWYTMLVYKKEGKYRSK